MARAAQLNLERARDAVVTLGGGFVDMSNQRLAVRHLSPAIDADSLADTLVRTGNGAPIRLGDVARVVEGHPAPIGSAIINDRHGILLICSHFPMVPLRNLSIIGLFDLWQLANKQMLGRLAKTH